MHILITNDDGVNAPGLLALTQAMRELGDVTILAPDRNWSASGHVKTMHRPIRVWPVKLADGTEALASDGAPSDCVALAILGVVKRKIDLVVSGINPNSNIGHDVTYSGTVTAAMEAAIWRLPGIAASLHSSGNQLELPDYRPAARATLRIARRVVQNGLPEGVLLNVNVPYLPEEEMKGTLVTRQGQRVYRDALVERTDPHGSPYYWIGGESPTGVAVDGTDFGALEAGYVSITPLQLDLSAYPAMEMLRTWEWDS